MRPSKWIPAAVFGAMLAAGANPGLCQPADKADAAPKIDWSDVQRFYEKIVPSLDKGRRSEATNQLMMILFNTRANPVPGWYGPGQSRYDWIWLAAQFDVNRDGKIVRPEFQGPDSSFSLLDRDRDGSVTQTDLDWTESSEWMRLESQAQRRFRDLDEDEDGALSVGEWKAWYDRLAGSKGALSPIEFRRMLEPSASNRGGGGAGMAMTPKLRHDRLVGVLKGDVGSFNEGPQLGELAPDFTLKTHDGKESVTLSSFRGKKPVVLTFGSYTCPPYRSLSPALKPLQDRYGDRVEFLAVYVREAHPTDGWATEGNSRIGIELKQPTSQSERLSVAQKYCSLVKPNFPLLVDEFDDRVGHLYSGMPNRLYLIDREGKVAYKSGRGPQGYKTGELEQSIVIYLLDRNQPADTPGATTISARAPRSR